MYKVDPRFRIRSRSQEKGVMTIRDLAEDPGTKWGKDGAPNRLPPKNRS